MNVRWEKRRNGYFAYARHSYYDKLEKKTKTVNKYLGADIKTAISNFENFVRDYEFDEEAITQAVIELQAKGQELGVKPDNHRYRYDNKEFIRQFHQTAGELYELILEADTAKKRKALQSEFIDFFTKISSFINSETK